MALVLVLWMLMLLTLIANGVAMTARSEAQIAGNLVAAARAEAAADAAIHRAIAELTVPAGVPGRWPSDGRENRWSFDGIDIRVRISDESAKVDLNYAPPALLASLLRAVGVAPAEADAIADAILDWRDPDDFRQARGAEQGDYAAAGKNYGPANALFVSVDELRLVVGVTEAIFRAVSPYVTIFSHSGTVNATAARRPVLLAIPGASPALVDAYIDQRQTLLERGLPPPQFALAPGTPSGANSYYAIGAEAYSSDNTRFFREAVIRLTGNPASPFVIFSWRSTIPAAAQPDHPSAEH